MEQKRKDNSEVTDRSSEVRPLPVNFQLFSSPSTVTESKNDKCQPLPQALSIFQTNHTTTQLTTMTSLGNEMAPAAKSNGGKNSEVPSWKDLRPFDINLSNFQGLVCVHLDPFVLTLPDSYSEAIGTLKFQHFGGNLDNGEKFINDLKSARIFIISSGGLGAQFVPKIHHLPQVYAIYIHCEDVDGHKKWAKKYSKVRVVCFDDKRELLPVLATDAAQCHNDWGDAFLKAGEKAKAVARYEKAIEKLNKKDANDPEMRDMIKKKLESLK